VRTGGPPRHLARRPAEGKLGGVCAGIAAYLDADVTLVRLSWIVLSIVPGVFVGGVLAYLAAWVLMPAAPAEPALPHAHRLMRSLSDRRIAGVCGGLSEYLEVDATLVRVIVAILAIYPGAIVGGVIVYAIAWLIIPQAQGTLQSVTTTA
jgi:phage shock protein PspC (stress-responsive transcriptional regulator)